MSIENVIEIRSNISTGFYSHLKRVADDEEREKAERAAKIAIEKEKREKEFNEWKRSHPNRSAYTYCNEYNFKNPSCYDGGYCKIHFYEWGNIESTPREFNYYGPFYTFLDECGLMFTAEQNNKIRPLSQCYITCLPNSPEMVVSATYEGLKNELRMAAAGIKSAVQQPAPTISNYPVTVYDDD